MADCVCHPLFCNVQQTVFDTVHTAVFSDTIHTVKVVTAKVKLDSTYTIDLLNKVEYSSNESVAQAEMKEVGEAVSMIRKLQKDLTEFLATEQK